MPTANTWIGKLLSGRGVPLGTPAIPIKQILITAGLRHDAEDHVHSTLGKSSTALVCDSATYEALGRELERRLHDAHIIVLESPVRPDEKTIRHVRDKSASCQALVAVGSGTINDVCKYASFLDDKPYIVFGTAASMNGYCSANASVITQEGYRQSLPAHLPHGVFLDTEILCAAPHYLSASGLGDSICRPTAQADWLLSHLLLDTPYSPLPFTILEESEEEFFDNADILTRPPAMQKLAETLVLSGLGMTLSGGSYPASQAEHMVAHTMEMRFAEKYPDTLHGQQIAVTTLTMARLQEHILKTSPTPHIRDTDDSVILDFFGKTTGRHCLNAYRHKEKYLHSMPIPDWQTIRSAITPHMIPSHELKAILQSAGAPCHYSDLGWQKDDYLQALLHACFSRDRFTFLDIAFHTHLLEEVLDGIC